jgi:hypothetical protein
MAQDGIEQDDGRRAVIQMGGRDTHDTQHMVTETAVRAFYRHYRSVMGV